MLLALIGATAAFVAVGAVFVILGGGLRNPVEARLSRLAPISVGSAKEAPFSDRVMIPVVDGIVSFIVQLLPAAFVARTNRQLLAAGSPMSPQGFFTFVFITGIGFPLASLFLLLQAVNAVAVLPIVAITWSAGIMLPFFWLRRRARSRKVLIWKRLSDAFDLVTVCVEAGLGLDAALRQVALRMKGPLAEEIALTLRQVGMGRARREALEDMAYRIDIPEVTTFVNSIIQAEQLGTSLGRTLRTQAVSLRVHRRQRAEAQARRAPVKMVFPLVLFIMPTFFIVTIGPIAVHLVKYLSEN